MLGADYFRSAFTDDIPPEIVRVVHIMPQNMVDGCVLRFSCAGGILPR